MVVRTLAFLVGFGTQAALPQAVFGVMRFFAGH